MYIIDCKRTPIGKFLGGLSSLSAPKLTAPLFEFFLTQYPFLSTATDEVILGNVLQAGIGQNPARIAASLGGINYSVPAYTVNQVCASSLNAIALGYRAIKAGDSQLILAGGMESMSQAPHIIRNFRLGHKFGSANIIDTLQHDGLFCSLSQKSMGETAENIAQKYHISRHDQDRYAYQSHRCATAAQKAGILESEIIEVEGFRVDEGPRGDTSLTKLASLKPAFKNSGSVTAGNASPLSDGAALCLLASEKAVKKYAFSPQAKILDTVFVGSKPELMGMGPKYAIKKILKRNKLTIADIDLFEINEAFAVQVLAVIGSLKIPASKVNIYGGAIALGHPLGMSGARIVGSLINGLKLTDGKIGVASLCIGGGQGAAILLEVL